MALRPNLLLTVYRNTLYLFSILSLRFVYLTLLDVSAETQMKLKEIWKQTNLQEGELSQYYEDTSMTEYELYSLHRERGSIIRKKNCTIMKGILSNETFVNSMKDSKSESYELLRVKFQDMFLEIGREDDIPYFQTFVMNLDQTDDCKVAFTIQVPWTNQAQQGGLSTSRNK